MKKKYESIVFASLCVTQQQADNLCAATVHQSISEVWFEHRVGRITASHMHNVFSYKGKRYPSSLINSIMQYRTINSDIPALK